MTALPQDELAYRVIVALAGGIQRRVDKPWGYEIIIETDSFLIKYIEVYDGQSTSLQHHEIKREVQYIIGGAGYVEEHTKPGNGYHGRYTQYWAGDHVTIEPGVIHRTIGPVTLIEVTTLHNDDVVRHEDRYGRANGAPQTNVIVPSHLGGGTVSDQEENLRREFGTP